MVPGTALWVVGGAGAPPLGMTKTPTLWVFAVKGAGRMRRRRLTRRMRGRGRRRRRRARITKTCKRYRKPLSGCLEEGGGGVFLILAKNDLERNAHTYRGGEEARSLVKDLNRHALLAVAWSRHWSPVPRWT